MDSRFRGNDKNKKTISRFFASFVVAVVFAVFVFVFAVFVFVFVAVVFVFAVAVFTDN